MAAPARVARLAGRHRHVHRRRLARASCVTARWRSSGSPRPAEHDPAELSDPRHFAYWRRAADVVTSGIVAATPGLRGPLDASVEEDVDGITLVQDWVEDAANSGLFAAHAMGRFAGADLGDTRWLARDQLRDRHGAGRPPRRLEDAGPDHGGRRRRPPVAPSRTACSTRSTRSPRCRSTATRCPPTCPAARPTRWSRSTGGCSATAGRRRPGLLPALRARGVRAAAGRLPDGAARTAWPAPRRSRWAPGSPRSTPSSRGPSGRWRGWPAARARWPRSTATLPWRRTSGRCSGSSRRSRRCWRWPTSCASERRRPRTCRRPPGCPARSRS